eukprot:454435-Amphidinium_carterae.1
MCSFCVLAQQVNWKYGLTKPYVQSSSDGNMKLLTHVILSRFGHSPSHVLCLKLLGVQSKGMTVPFCSRPAAGPHDHIVI